MTQVQPLTHVTFLDFMMYFHKIEQVDHLITKAMLPSKQIKLSHLISMYGHLHLMDQSIAAIAHYQQRIQSRNEIQRGGNCANFDFDDMKMYIDDSYSSPVMSPRDLQSPAVPSDGHNLGLKSSEANKLAFNRKN